MTCRLTSDYPTKEYHHYSLHYLCFTLIPDSLGSGKDDINLFHIGFQYQLKYEQRNVNCLHNLSDIGKGFGHSRMSNNSDNEYLFAMGKQITEQIQ